MVDNHAARTSDQDQKPGKHGWISKVVIIAIFVGIIAALVLLT